MPQSETAHQHKPVSRGALIIGAIVVVAILVVFLVMGTLHRHSQYQSLVARARQSALADSVPFVTVGPVKRASASAELTLPSTLQANHEASVYARSSGYVRHWYADIGQHVRAGQILADINAPDLDQQLAQAQQQVSNTKASQQLAAADLARWQTLYHDSTVTKQELDQHQSSYDALNASVLAAQADVRRYEALVGYEKVTAPFSGVVTSRNVEEGVFVTSAGMVTTPQAAGAGGNTLVGGSGGSELFRVATTDTIRVYLGVPQAYAPSMSVGLPATITVTELPGQEFQGRVTRTASSVDAASRTLLTEVDIVNRQGKLIPGTYAQVHFQFIRPTPPILIPGTALIFRTGAPQVAVIGQDSVAHFHTISIGRDYGTVMEVLAGLNEGDLVVTQPLDNLRDGQHVRQQMDTANAAGSGNSGPGGFPANPPKASKQGEDGGGDSARSQPVPPSHGGGPRPAQQANSGKNAAPANASSGANGYHPPPEVSEGFPGAAGGGVPRTTAASPRDPAAKSP